MPAVERPCVSAVKPVHSATEIRRWRLDQQVQMVAHQAVSERPPALSPDHLGEVAEIATAIDVVDEDRLLDGTARPHVVDRAGALGAWNRHALDRASARFLAP